MSEAQTLPAEIETFLATIKMAVSTFGRKTVVWQSTRNIWNCSNAIGNLKPFGVKKLRTTENTASKYQICGKIIYIRPRKVLKLEANNAWF
jgi:hypothetical protein